MLAMWEVNMSSVKGGLWPKVCALWKSRREERLSLRETDVQAKAVCCGPWKLPGKESQCKQSTALPLETGLPPKGSW